MNFVSGQLSVVRGPCSVRSSVLCSSASRHWSDFGLKGHSHASPGRRPEGPVRGSETPQRTCPEGAGHCFGFHRSDVWAASDRGAGRRVVAPFQGCADGLWVGSPGAGPRSPGRCLIPRALPYPQGAALGFHVRPLWGVSRSSFSCIFPWCSVLSVVKSPVFLCGESLP